MKKTLLAATLLAILTPGAAQAGPKFFDFWWWSSHWTDQDFIPYYDNGTDPQNNQWSNSNWTPDNWIASSGGDSKALVQKWMDVGILAGSYRDWSDIPYLDVGPNFYHLSGYDKRRVVETLDAIYQVTARKPGMFYLKDAGTDKIIGTYTKDGLFLE